MENLADRHKEALRLVDRLIALNIPDAGAAVYVRKLRERFKLPMSIVLDKLYPDLTIVDKAERLGVTRQAYYGWLYGTSRPNAKLSKRIAALTGFNWVDIRGKPTE